MLSPRSSARSSSGAVEIRLRSWLRARTRSLRALERATRSTRMDSTLPFRVLARLLARPDSAARAASTASRGSDFPARRRSCRLGRSTSTTRMPLS
jgi:hypothetical protein